MIREFLFDILISHVTSSNVTRRVLSIPIPTQPDDRGLTMSHHGWIHLLVLTETYDASFFLSLDCHARGAGRRPGQVPVVACLSQEGSTNLFQRPALSIASTAFHVNERAAT